MTKIIFKKQNLFFFLFLFPCLCFGETGAFPTKVVLVQFFNFSLFVVTFVILIRKPLADFFHKRQEDFVSFEKEAKKIETEKKEEEKIWDDKLSKVKQEELNIHQKGKLEGERFIREKQEELNKEKLRLEQAKQLLIHLESEKAKRQLLKKWKKKISEKAQEKLLSQVKTSAFQTHRLKDFFEHMEKKN